MNINEKLKNCIKTIKSFLMKNREFVVVEISPTFCRSIVYDNSKTLGISFFWKYEDTDTRDGENNICETVNITNSISQLKQELLKEDFNLDSLFFVVNLVDMSYMGTLELPVLSENELKEALDWEITQRLPWKAGMAEYRYQNKNSYIKTDEESLTDIQELEFYALSKETIARIVNVFTQEKLKLCCLTIDSSIYSDVNEQAMVNEVDFFAGFYNKQKLEELHSVFDKAILTAIKYCEGSLNIDFLSTKQHYEAICNLLEKVSKGMTCLLLGLSLVIMVSIKGINFYEQQQRDTLQTKLQKLEVWEKRLLVKHEQDKKLERLQEMVKQIENGKIKWSEHITKISNCLPENCWLTKLEQETGKQQAWLVLYGKAENVESVTMFMSNLKEKGKYAKVELLYSNTLAEDKSYFSLVTDFKIKIKIY